MYELTHPLSMLSAKNMEAGGKRLAIAAALPDQKRYIWWAWDGLV
jgi:hypothetical protein